MAERPLALLGFTAFACLFFLGSLPGLLHAWLLLALSVGAGALLLLLLKKADSEARKRLLAMLSACSLCCTAFSGLYITQTKTQYEPTLTVEGQNITLKAKLISAPQKAENRYTYILQISERGGRPFRAKLRYQSFERLPYEPHTTLTINAERLYPLSGSSWKSRGIYLGAYGSIADARPPESKPLSYHILRLQDAIVTRLMGAVPTQEGALLLGLLLGNTDYINNTNYINSKLSGVTHLYSVSGLHVSIWSMLLAALLAKLRLKKHLYAPLGILFLVFLMALTSFTPPAVRSGLTMLVFFVGSLITRRADSLNSLGLAMLLMLLANPFSALSASLVLSFFATLGILLFSQKIQRALKAKTIKIPYSTLQKLLNLLTPSLSISLCVTLTTLPWMLYFFGSVSVIAPITNLFIILPSSAAMALTGTALLCSGFDLLFYPLLTLASLLAKYILAVSAFFASLPAALVRIEPFLLTLSITAATLFALYLLRKRHSLRFLRAAYLLFALLLLVSNVLYTLIPSRRVELTVPSVGNGSALLVQQNGRSALLGCGGSPSALTFTLSNQNTNRLDFLLLPRTQPTESRAAANILRDFSPQEILAATDFTQSNNLPAAKTNYTNSYQGSFFNNISLEYQNTADFSALLLQCNGRKIIFCFLPASDFSRMGEHWQSGDILISRAALPKTLDPSRFSHIIVHTDKSLPSPTNTTAALGSIRIIIAKDGAISLTY